MPLFITIRAAIYGTVLLFTLICLAMSGHFQHVLAASDLTRFVPFAIFVCTVSMLMFITLFFLRERNPISTRIELGCLGFAGFLWLVLGVFLTTSESQDADVECFSSATAVVPLDDSVASFHTSQYHAMYRVLMTFSLMNAMLVLLAFLALLFLALRRHRMGDEHMWHGPVTSCAWFNDYGNNKPQRRKTGSPILPTTEKGRGTRAPFGGNAAYTTPAVPAGVPHRQHRSKGHSSHRNGGQSSRKQQYQRNSGDSLIGSSISSHDFDAGKIRNPNDEKQYRR
ncbi:hypothetical protein BDN72DRAFT_867634 [Pluteus cervinus]|uniref:Uncharacterized protein n=1 Tax=Pluteus cervinus TaxID=181527 RepID=A0ACD3BE60_9AGAR|nr:hypothetical protein BDN72DRAFT_867634 [Pluteus cervinus]